MGVFAPYPFGSPPGKPTVTYERPLSGNRFGALTDRSWPISDRLEFPQFDGGGLADVRQWVKSTLCGSRQSAIG